MISLLLGAALAMIPSFNALSQAQELAATDRFEIFSAMNLHQAYIDLDQTCDNAKVYADLFWPDASFRVVDEKSSRDLTVHGHVDIRGNFDSAHSVFPLAQWRHSMGVFQIFTPYTASNGNTRVGAHWNWRVDWKANTTGVVSTGYYDDVFEKRSGAWKVLHRTSHDDPNWPIQTFWPYIINAKNLFASSCGDTTL